MSSQETKIGGKKIGKIRLGEPAPIEEFRPLPRRLPQHDWPAVLNSVPLGSYVDLRREDGTPWTWATVYFAIMRLVRQGVIQNGEFKVRTHKVSSGQEATLLFHYGKLNPKPRNTTPSSPSIRSRRDIKNRISNSSYEEGLFQSPSVARTAVEQAKRARNSD